MDKFCGSRKDSSRCEGCSKKLSTFRWKIQCLSCKKEFCRSCLIPRTDKKKYCRKCQILTATPLDKNDLLNLRSKDLVNYLASRHISRNGCFEKEDLVNALMRASNETNSPSVHSFGNSGSNSYSNSPVRNSFPCSQRESDREEPRRSGGHLNTEDGIRIVGIDAPENESSSSNHSTNSEVLNESDWSVVDEGSGVNAEAPDQNDESNDDVNNPSPAQNEAQSTNSNEAKVSDLTKKKSIKTLKLSDITCSADLDNLSVKELKTLLMTNRTDFKGCVERAELIEKASRLWTDYTSSRRDLEKLSLEELCKICMDAPIECVLLECGHLATCMSCGKQLSECPVCRQYVIRCVRTFKA